jgi:hypothetical protein
MRYACLAVLSTGTIAIAEKTLLCLLFPFAVCASGIPCNGVCVDPSQDGNCGACGKTCASLFAVNSTCQYSYSATNTYQCGACLQAGALLVHTITRKYCLSSPRPHGLLGWPAGMACVDPGKRTWTHTKALPSFAPLCRHHQSMRHPAALSAYVYVLPMHTLHAGFQSGQHAVKLWCPHALFGPVMHAACPTTGASEYFKYTTGLLANTTVYLAPCGSERGITHPSGTQGQLRIHWNAL